MSGKGRVSLKMIRALAARRAFSRRPLETFPVWSIVKGDIVEVIEGKSAGERGKIKGVNRRRNIVFVEGVQLVKKHQRGDKEQKGGIFTSEGPIHVSNVSLLDPYDKKPTKVSWKFDKTGKRIRLSRRSGKPIPKPKLPEKVPPSDGPRDTLVQDALKVTYKEPEYVKEIDKLAKDLSFYCRFGENYKKKKNWIELKEKIEKRKLVLKKETKKQKKAAKQ